MSPTSFPQPSHTIEPAISAETYSKIRRNMTRISPEFAEDFTQESIQRALKAKAALTDPELVPYCTQTGKHFAYDQFKRESRMHPAGLDGCTPARLRAASPDPIRRLQLQQALQKLTEQHRRVLLLYYFVGLTTQEIGLRLGMTAGHVQVVLHRGRTKLKQILVNSCRETVL